MNWANYKLGLKKENKEKELIEGCISNKRKAQKELYDKYSSAMFTIALRMSGNRDDAHDILQEVFIQVFNDIKSFKRISTLGAWIKTITVRTSIRKIKKRIIFDDLTEEKDLPQIKPDIHINMDYLEKSINDLAEGYRTVFLLVEVEGYSHKEVAKLLEISEGTSKSQLFYAKKLLRKKLSTYSIGE
ncbi:MAG: RNA polymerase sigma factor [Bacteroidales bacterium]